MPFIYRFVVYFIPVKTKEKLINYFSSLLFNHQQKEWIEDVLIVLDQKNERVSSQMVQLKVYFETQFELITLNHTSLEGKLLSKINNQNKVIEYYGDELSKVIQGNKQLTDEYPVIAQLIQKQEALIINLKKELNQFRELHNFDIKQLYQGQKDIKSDVEEELSKISELYSFDIKQLYQGQKDIKSDVEEQLCETMKRLSDDSILNDSEYRNWEMQFESKGTQSNYFENLLSEVKPGDIVLDVGCGVGKLLEYARATKGAKVKGVDISQNGILQCIDKGLDVICEDALLFLEKEELNTYDFVTLIHIVEHIQPVELRRILNRVYDVLKPNGRIIIETPNIQSLFTLSRYYYMDSTHKRPKHPSLLKFVIEQIGFKDVEFDYSGDIPEGMDFLLNTSSSDAYGKLLNELFYSGGGNIYIEGRK